MPDSLNVRSYPTEVTTDNSGRVMVPVPFDPDEVWGKKPRHHVAGTIGGMGYRGVVEPLGEGLGVALGPAWRRDCGIGPGDLVEVTLFPEGPQRDGLAADIQAALDDSPEAGAFFDSLAQFYRNAYLRWIDSTKRRPELRADRIVEVVSLLERGIKQRP